MMSQYKFSKIIQLGRQISDLNFKLQDPDIHPNIELHSYLKDQIRKIDGLYFDIYFKQLEFNEEIKRILEKDFLWDYYQNVFSPIRDWFIEFERIFRKRNHKSNTDAYACYIISYELQKILCYLRKFIFLPLGDQKERLLLENPINLIRKLEKEIGLENIFGNEIKPILIYINDFKWPYGSIDALKRILENFLILIQDEEFIFYNQSKIENIIKSTEFNKKIQKSVKESPNLNKKQKIKIRIEKIKDLIVELIYEHIMTNPSLLTEKRRNLPLHIKETIIERDKGICQICLENTKEKLIEIDHVFPYSLGGTSKIFNLMLTCKNCNQDKGKKTDYFYSTEGKKKMIENIKHFVKNLNFIKDFISWLKKEAKFIHKED